MTAVSHIKKRPFSPPLWKEQSVMKKLSLLDDSLKVAIYFEQTDSEFDDDICICFEEDCPEDERIFKADETNIFLTPDQANQFALALIAAAKQSLGFADDETAVQK